MSRAAKFFHRAAARVVPGYALECIKIVLGVRGSGDILMSKIVFKPIGQVKAQFPQTDMRAENKEAGELEIHTEFEPALEGIDGYSDSLCACLFRPAESRSDRPVTGKAEKIGKQGIQTGGVAAARRLRTWIRRSCAREVET